MPFRIVNDLAGIQPDAKVVRVAAASDEELRNGLHMAFSAAVRDNSESFAIALEGDETKGLTNGRALRIALSETERFLEDSDADVMLSLSGEYSGGASSECAGDIEDYISRNYREPVSPAMFMNAVPVADAARFEATQMLPMDEISGEAAVEADEETPAPPRKPARKRSLFKSRAKEAASADFGASMGAPAGAAQVPFAISGHAERRSLDDVVRNLDKTFMELVFSFADAKGFSDVEVQKKANLDRKAFSKLKCGTTRNPSKGTALALAVALELSLDETKDLLSRAGYALSPCSKQDVIVKYFIEREAYDIYEINAALFEHGEQLLGCQAS